MSASLFGAGWLYRVDSKSDSDNLAVPALMGVSALLGARITAIQISRRRRFRRLYRSASEARCPDWIMDEATSKACAGGFQVQFQRNLIAMGEGVSSSQVLKAFKAARYEHEGGTQ